LGGFRHVDRNDPANVAASRFTFIDEAGNPGNMVSVQHAGRRAGLTLFVLPRPVTARRVRWQVTKLANENANCVGGAEITFFRAGDAEPAPRGIGIAARSEPVVENQGGRLAQPLSVVVDYPYGKPADVVLRVDGQESRPSRLTFGSHRFTFATPVVESDRTLRVAVD